MSKRRYLGWEAERRILTKRKFSDSRNATDFGRDTHFDALRGMNAALVSLRNERVFCDITLRLDDGTALPAHRVVLAAGSTYFCGAFTSGLTCGPPDNSEIALHDVSLPTARCLLDFLYERRVALNHELARDLLVLADFLGVVDLLGTCCEFLSDALAPENCISTMRFARCYKDARCRSLADTAYSYLMVNFVTVSQRSTELLSLPVEELELLLSSDELNVASEERVLDCVVRWMSIDKSSRPNHALRLLRRVRFGLLPPESLPRYMRRHPWLVECARRFMSEKIEATWPSLMKEVSTQTQARVSQQTLFAIGGWSGPKPTDFVEVYDCRRDTWSECPSASDPGGPRAYHGAVAIGSRVLVVGGFDGRHKYYSSCRWFDPRTRAWSEAGAMRYKRCYVSLAVVSETVYALGGFDGNFRHNTAERYCVGANQWVMISPMHEQRSDASAAALDGKVYVAGGFDGLECIASCEVFDPTTGQWTMLRPMAALRSGVSCIALHGFLYALGGFNGEHRLASCERFDPLTGTWQFVSDMLFARSNFGCELLDGRIHVFGGFNGSSTCPDTECFDTDADCWLPRAYMHLHRSALATVALYALPNRAELFDQEEDPTRARVLELMCDWRDTMDAPPPERRPRPRGGDVGVAGCSGDQ